MPRPLWSGSITFGLVTVPVKVYPAVRRHTVRFHQLHCDTGNRVRRKRVDEATGEEVDSDDIVKGYELAPDQYVVIEPDELRTLDPKSSRTIDIEDFVELADIDPIYFDSSYYLVPQETAQKPYRLLHEAMQASGKAAVARFVLRSKQYLAVLRPLGDAIAVSTMVYHDEVVPTARLDGLPGEDVEVDERELRMAEQLIDAMTSAWEPEKYEDTYRQKVLDLIEQKAAGQEIVSVPDAEKESGDVVDLMAALEQSLQAAKDDQAQSA